MTDDTLPTGPELVARLVALGLAPVGVTREGFDPFDAADWEPWKRIEQAWPLVEKMGLSIEFSHRHHSWWIGRPSGLGVIVLTFAEIPQGVCQVALKVAAGRTG